MATRSALLLEKAGSIIGSIFASCSALRLTVSVASGARRGVGLRVSSLLADGVVGAQVKDASSVDDARRGITTEYSVCYSPPAVTPAFATTYHLRRVGLAQVLLVASSNDADILARKAAKTVQPPFSCTQLRVTG